MYSIFWTWIHLLQLCISNQSLESEEDALNKPWRPIPSRLISVARARTLRWILLPLCLFVSLRLGAQWPSISLVLATLAYHELQFDSHVILRNLCNAWGYASFNAGAAMIASGTSHVFLFKPTSYLTGRTFLLGQSTLTVRIAISVAVNSLIILSTVHSQDFRDQTGDKLAGRWTIPMAWPRGSRFSILVFLTAWSVGLSWTCGLACVFSVPFCMLAVFVGLRFIQKKTADEDKKSYQYYNVRFQ